ncbi:MAG: ATP-binding protein [Hadesarchaea archaeon]|nr:ATP-binding protein [Hadesarchaea archaeon]
MISPPTNGPISTEIGDDYFNELAYSNLDFVAALCELIDNSITGALKEMHCIFNIDVLIFPVNSNLLQVTIADDGTGIPRTDIQDGVFRPAGRTRFAGQCYKGLREHGFGLKQALAWLTKETGFGFEIRTAYKASRRGLVEYTKVVGPLQKNMSWETSNKREWNEWVNPRGPNKETGTRIRFQTTLAQAKSAWKERFQISPESIRDMRDLIKFLKEQLGVTCRHFLATTKSKRFKSSIRILWTEGPGLKRRSLFIQPIRIPYIPQPMRSTYRFQTGGKTLQAVYIRGISDPDQVHNNSIFYKHDERSQGLDIALHGKVIESAFYPWVSTRHPAQNGLVGELLIRSDDVATILTKNKLDWESPLLIRLKSEMLLDDSEHRGKKTAGRLYSNLISRIPTSVRATNRRTPPRLKSFLERERIAIITPRRPTAPYRPIISLTETQLKDYLANFMRRVMVGVAGVSVRREHKPWQWLASDLDLSADLTYEDSRGLYIFECKLGDAEPRDLYQILMYWDGFAESLPSERDPIRAFLIAEHFPDRVRSLRNYLLENKMDKNGNPYDIRFRTWRTLGLRRDRLPTSTSEDTIRKFLATINTCR